MMSVSRFNPCASKHGYVKNQ